MGMVPKDFASSYTIAIVGSSLRVSDVLVKNDQIHPEKGVI